MTLAATQTTNTVQRPVKDPSGSARFGTKPQDNATILHSGDTLYRMGDELKGIYLINAGAIKLYRITESGDQQIIGFYVP